MSALTSPERADLARLEQQIQAGIAAFHEVGHALLEIRDRRLYRVTHATWEDYCRERWGFSASHAYRLISAADVVDDLSPIGETPANEAQARALLPLPTAAQRQEVWTEARAGGATPTAARLAELTARALAGLPPEEQREAVEREERRVLNQSRRDDRRDRLDQLERLVRRCRRLHAGLTEVADAADRLLDQYLALILSDAE